MDELEGLIGGMSAEQHQESMNVQIACSISNALIQTRGITEIEKAISLFDEVWESLSDDQEDDEEDEEDVDEDEDDEDEEEEERG